MTQNPVIQLLHYTKRKNTTLFEHFRNTKDFIDIQNYIPLYNGLFELNDTNYNSFNLNNLKYLYDIEENTEGENVFILKKNDSDENIHSNIHIKYAPVLDPFKYFIGKYKFNIDDCKLPLFRQNDHEFIHPDLFSKMYDINNSAYVDGFFTYLSGEILHRYNFIHGVEFYGSYYGIKKDFKINISDDIDYLCRSEYFINNDGKLFFVDDYSSITKEITSSNKLPPIKIDNFNKGNLSANSIKDDMFEDIFELDNKVKNENNNDELQEIEDINIIVNNDIIEHKSSLKSTSTCSSRTSFTETEEGDEEKSVDSDDDEKDSQEEDLDKNEEEEEEDNSENTSDSNSNSDSDSSSYEPIFATIPKFPVNIICMEKFEDTFDNLILTDEIHSMNEWFAILMQIIMTLIAYQKCFAFTHNDLHTNNIMYVQTEEKFLFYCYNEKYYKIPTYGRLFKIIDFGRSIYKMNNHLFCSDSFKKGEDAATQYNIEPYFNENKPRIEPNYSFDLCRLACSIFDYLVEDMEEIVDLKSCSPIVQLIVEWCLDDNGLNVLYKSNGDERYEDFKLYKMIARSVHNHTPQKQLERSEFKQFLIEKKKLPKTKLSIMNIDLIPVC